VSSCWWRGGIARSVHTRHFKTSLTASRAHPARTKPTPPVQQHAQRTDALVNNITIIIITITILIQNVRKTSGGLIATFYHEPYTSIHCNYVLFGLCSVLPRGSLFWVWPYTLCSLPPWLLSSQCLLDVVRRLS